MKRSHLYLFAAICTFPLLFSAGGCGSGSRTGMSVESNAGTGDPLLAGYLRDARSFQASLVRLSDADAAAIPVNFEHCRQAFKRVEYLLEYIDRERHALFNGAPVVRENHAAPGFDVLESQGLQVLEEMICAGIPDRTAFRSALEELEYQADLWTGYVNVIKLDPGTWINAVLIHLIRVETLSLAGFDRPCADNPAAIVEENRISFRTIRSVLEMSTGISGTTVQKFQHIDSILAVSSSLDDIQLSAFIRDEIQPLRADIIRLRSEFDNGAANEDPPRPYDLTTTSLYDPDFLDASYFSAYGMRDQADEQTDRKRRLGSSLFQEPLLSESGPMSCGTCHQPDRYFTDGVKRSSSNIPGRSLERNTPTLIHSGYQSAYMYDARATSLEDQLMHVFRNEMEFNTQIDRVIERLSMHSAYRDNFDALYPEMQPNSINLQTVSDALSTYVRSLTGHQSPFDRYMRGELDELDKSVSEGFQLFMTKGKCGTCHFAPTFFGLVPPFYTDSELENIGTPVIDSLGSWHMDPDPGRFRFYADRAFRHFFKTTTLRNSARTGPYMHNGVFDSLDAVIDFYNNGGGAGAGLAYTNQTLPPDTLGLSVSEIAAILDFIKALTDTSYEPASGY